MRTKFFAYAALVVTLVIGGAAWAFTGTDTPAPQDETAGCCVTGDCCCPGQGSCCDPTKRATGDIVKTLKKTANCCSTGNCCCPGAGSCCTATTTEVKADAKECCTSTAKASCCSK